MNVRELNDATAPTSDQDADTIEEKTTAEARAFPLMRQSLTVCRASDPDNIATVQLVILDDGQDNWFDLPESREAGWSNIGAGGLVIRFRVIG